MPSSLLSCSEKTRTFIPKLKRESGLVWLRRLNLTERDLRVLETRKKNPREVVLERRRRDTLGVAFGVDIVREDKVVFKVSELIGHSKVA